MTVQMLRFIRSVVVLVYHCIYDTLLCRQFSIRPHRLSWELNYI
jgi:hypothetical protein